MQAITIKQAQQLIQLEQGEAWTTSVVIAEQFGRRHNDVLRAIEALADDGTIDVRDFSLISFTDKMNRNQRAYRLSERAALIAMPFIGGRKSREGQKRLVDAFLAMRKLLRQQDAYRMNAEWLEARATGKVIRLTTTDTIQDFVSYAMARGSRNAHKYYLQITKMENRALFLIDKAVGDGFRDRLTAMQLVNLATAESVAQRALREGMERDLPYKDIYQLAKLRVETLAQMVGKTLPGERLGRLAA